MNFRIDLCIYKDNSLVVFLEKFSFTSSILVKNAKKKMQKKCKKKKKKKKNVYEDKWFRNKIFYQIKIQANTNWSSHHKKLT